MIDAKKYRDVAKAYIPGAFLQIDDTSSNTPLKFDGMLEELLACIDPVL